MAKDTKKKTVKSKAAAAPRTKKRTATVLPMPDQILAGGAPRKAVLRAAGKHLAPLDVPAPGDIEVLQRLWDTIESRRTAGESANSHSARLMARGTAKVAQKLGEEAVECVIEATQGNRPELILESADLLYHLMVVWVDAGIRPEEVWSELTRREGISGIAEKAARPKGILRAADTTKLP
ncbi:phosphoribosyl-ATP diphosphatase [Pseudoroseomonas globiformis]|uniref:Phosphoribosyl-ATP pyrophosphatase n=1 Tax=Teichococcus globiformis TaxID=2307229 RepID=A0ABV7FY27_9PROT